MVGPLFPLIIDDLLVDTFQTADNVHSESYPLRVGAKGRVSQHQESQHRLRFYEDE